MSFLDKLLLWLHIAFAIFAIGPLTAVTSYVPRYIRARDLNVLRFLKRAERVFGSLTLGVFLFGILLGGSALAKVYLTVSMTLFIVAAVLLVIIDRDITAAIRVLENDNPDDDAKVQTGRIAALGGVTALIWLVILVLMVFNDPVG
ncbi:hypothetical protein Aph01nite_37280 [Acrocarpospora phusangensis]|uniref:DUF2269 family protein n=1 Tax=Acrocarpospora phusangensis TaxID=1070424 RepID=A0A919QB55_9ACTN|nr:hypothetical protein [Acrocarpospora phusangensis]GIH25418.1 hypothetical protein Aph01nite_37280 [Acrocarpospora phusangensis]